MENIPWRVGFHDGNWGVDGVVFSGNFKLDGATF
jgi:hypothetical protein